MTAEEPDMGGLLAQMQEMQQRLMDVQQAASAQVVEGSAGGGMVTVQVTGGMDIVNVTIDPSVVDPADIEMLQDLVLAAMRDAIARANDLNRQALGGLGLGGGLEGLIGG
jgi:DNA-binding YbaB/EbfC family protein